MSFPLYDQLLKSIESEKEPTDKQLVKSIQKLDTDGQSKIYLLIRHHHKKNLIPLERLETNSTFDVSKFDSQLKKILNSFCKLHQKFISTNK